MGQHTHEVPGEGAPDLRARDEAHEVPDLYRRAARWGNGGRGLVGATARGVWSGLALSHLARRQLEDPGARTYDQPLGNVQPLALMALAPLTDVLPVSVATRVSRSSGTLIEMVAASGTVALTMADN